MSYFQNYYLREVLGIHQYIPLQKILDKRNLKRKWPCDILVVVSKTLSPEELVFTNKIMKSISVSNFSILEIKEKDEFIENKIKEATQKGLIKYAIVFSDEVRLSHKKILTSCSLNKLIGDSVEVKNRKKQLWSELQKIKREIVK